MADNGLISLSADFLVENLDDIAIEKLIEQCEASKISAKAVDRSTRVSNTYIGHRG